MIRLINRWIQQQLVSMIHDRFPHKRGREHEVPYDAYHPCGERTHPLGRISQTFFLDERARCRRRAIHMSMETYLDEIFPYPELFFVIVICAPIILETIGSGLHPGECCLIPLITRVIGYQQ